MSKPWPPPPDLASIQELVRAADPEGFLAEGAPVPAAQDEYEPEEEAILAALAGLSTEQLLTVEILPRLEAVWQQSFHLGHDQLAERRPALLSLAKEIERFFGPESKPRTRAEIFADEQIAP